MGMLEACKLIRRCAECSHNVAGTSRLSQPIRIVPGVQQHMKCLDRTQANSYRRGGTCNRLRITMFSR